MSKTSKVGEIILIVFAFFIGANLLWEVLSLMMTKNSDKLYSPDRKYYAQVQEINGGATTAFMTDLMIVDANSMIINFGFFYTGNDDNRKWVFGFDGALESIKPQWLDDHTLKITYTNCNRVLSKDTSWKDVKIVYEGSCSDK